MPQHVQRSMLFNFYTGFGRFRRSAWSKKWYGSGRTSRIASDAPVKATIFGGVLPMKQVQSLQNSTSRVHSIKRLWQVGLCLLSMIVQL